MTDTICTRCGKSWPQCNCHGSFLGPEVLAFVAEHGSGDSLEPALEGLVDRHGRLWAFNHVADAYTPPPGQVEPTAARGLGDNVSWFGSEQMGDYASLLGPFTEVRI